MMPREDFFILANKFVTKWNEGLKAGKEFDFSHIIVIGTVDGKELNTLVYVKAESVMDTLENMKVEVMEELFNL